LPGIEAGRVITELGVRRFLMNLSPANRHIASGGETESHPISVNPQYHEFAVFAYENSLARFSADNQHAASSMNSPEKHR
jgi:hypothetical protein